MSKKVKLNVVISAEEYKYITDAVALVNLYRGQAGRPVQGFDQYVRTSVLVASQDIFKYHQQILAKQAEQNNNKAELTGGNTKDGDDNKGDTSPVPGGGVDNSREAEAEDTSVRTENK